MIVELYTSIAARAAGIGGGRSKMRDAASLGDALARLGVSDPPALARYDDHSTDAALGAAWLARAASDVGLWYPPLLTADVRRFEGWTFGVP
jgi:hypothetical protein